MFDPHLPDPFTRTAGHVVVASAAATLANMQVDELIEMRRQIEDLLPVKDLKDLNLARELVLQVQALQALQQRVIQDTETPVNQVAQVANSLSSALTNLLKVQTEVYTSERLKKLENILIECLNKLPMAAQEEFLNEYERALGDHRGA